MNPQRIMLKMVMVLIAIMMFVNLGVLATRGPCFGPPDSPNCSYGHMDAMEELEELSSALADATEEEKW